MNTRVNYSTISGLPETGDGTSSLLYKASPLLLLWGRLTFNIVVTYSCAGTKHQEDRPMVLRSIASLKSQCAYPLEIYPWQSD